MNKHIIFAIRYSIIQANGGAWRSSNLTYEEYVQKILNPERLNIRESTFKNITLKSIENQEIPEKTKITTLIMISELLPQKNRETLEELKIEFNNRNRSSEIIIREISSKNNQPSSPSHPDKNINESIKATISELTKNDSESLIATVRIDDDDALSSKYAKSLDKYISKNNIGYIISFAHGIEGVYDHIDEKITDLRHSYFPKIALGLAYINRYRKDHGLDEKNTIHIYNTGNHTKVDERFPVIIDSTKPMYLRTLSNNNDSTGNPYHKYLPRVNGINTISSIIGISDIKNHALEPDEEMEAIEVSKTSSPWNSLICHLNERIRLREKQLKEALEKIQEKK